MSWLKFFHAPENLLAAAKLLNRERSRNVVTPPFTIQALDTPPSEVLVVVVSPRSDVPVAQRAVSFATRPNDDLWTDTINRMLSHINDQPQRIVFIVHGHENLSIMPIVHPRHIQILVPSELDVREWATLVQRQL